MTKQLNLFKFKYDNLILDGSHMAWRANYTVGDLSYGGRPTGVIFGVLRILRKVIEDQQPRNVIVAWDGGPSATRKKIYPEYKQHRKKVADSDPVKSLERERVYKQLSQLWNILFMFGVYQAKIDATEGDDIIAFLAQNLKGKSLVVSSDKDFIQLVNKDVSVLRPFEEQLITLKNFKQQTKCKNPQMYLYEKLLLGDSGDNVKNINRIGKKTAPKILSQIDLDLFKKVLQKKANFDCYKKDKLLGKLSGHEKHLRLNNRLVNLKKFHSFHLPNKTPIYDALNDEGEVSEKMIQKMFIRFGFQEFLAEFSIWVNSFKELRKNSRITFHEVA